MASNSPESDPGEVLRKRSEELQTLRNTEHDLSFGGDEREMTGELSTADQHPADVADFTFQREMSQTQMGILQEEEAQVNEALRRQAEGGYGICEQCGKRISQDRLEARPSATLCIECQRAQDASRIGR